MNTLKEGTHRVMIDKDGHHRAIVGNWNGRFYAVYPRPHLGNVNRSHEFALDAARRGNIGQVQNNHGAHVADVFDTEAEALAAYKAAGGRGGRTRPTYMWHFDACLID